MQSVTSHEAQLAFSGRGRSANVRGWLEKHHSCAVRKPDGRHCAVSLKSANATMYALDTSQRGSKRKSGA